MHVYAIGCGESFVKFGKADDPRARMADLQIGNPTKLRLIAIKACQEAAYDTESQIHADLGGANVRGEWFRVDDARLADILTRYEFTPIDDDPETNRERSVKDWYLSVIPSYSDQCRANLRKIHDAANDAELIATLINKCLTGRLAA
jgi:hypothetical protein